MKRRFMLVGAVILSLTFGAPAYGGTWYQPGTDYTYYTGTPGSRGEVCTGEVRQLSGSFYEMKINGKLARNQWVYVHFPDNNTQDIWCYFDENGKDLNGWKQLNGNWYYFGSGSMMTGWIRDGGEYYYMDPVTGVMKTSGTETRDGVTYEFSLSGLSKKIDGLKENGESGDGWLEENGRTYYMRNGQKVVNEWLQDGNAWYYVGADGAMYTEAHFIDGTFYMFAGAGRMMTGGHTYHMGVKYVLGADGKGIPTAMSRDELMYYSLPVEWCKATYYIYEYSQEPCNCENWKETLLDGLRIQWGVKSKQECIDMINKLFISGQIAGDKAAKAWNFSRAMMLCNTGYKVNWWDYESSLDMMLSMAPTIQQSFTSWEEFNDSYMQGFIGWNGAGGPIYDQREKAYNSTKNSDYFKIDWNTKLEKVW